jgi:hypothetical protein
MNQEKYIGMDVHQATISVIQSNVSPTSGEATRIAARHGRLRAPGHREAQRP